MSQTPLASQGSARAAPWYHSDGYCAKSVKPGSLRSECRGAYGDGSIDHVALCGGLAVKEFPDAGIALAQFFGEGSVVVTDR